MALEQEISPTDILDAAETMKSLHISRRTLDRYVASGKLAALYLPSGHRRFRALDVSRVLKSPAVPSSPEVDGAAGVSFVST